MVLCPVDIEACERPACRAGWCNRARDRCIVACSDCGELIEDGYHVRFCVSCVALYRVTHKDKE